MSRRPFTLISALSLLACVGVLLGWSGLFSTRLPALEGCRAELGRRGGTVSYFNRACDPDYFGQGNISKSRPVDFHYLFLEVVRQTDLPGRPVASWILIVPPWFLLPALAASPAAWAVRRLWTLGRSRRRARIGLCPSCGYDLRATPERCPECGAAGGGG